MNFGNANEACFFATYISPLEYPTAIDLVARNKVNVQSLITHRFKMKDFERAIETANDPTQKPVKVIITD